MKLRAVMKSGMLLHFLVVSQWIVLNMVLIFNFDSSILVTGALGNGGLKAITLFHLWIFLFSIVLFSIFFRVRKEGMAEKSIAGLSLMIFAFSTATIYLRFIDNFVLLMKAMEVIAWSLHNGIFSISVYRILAVFLLPLLKR